jgi:hypothetical protein
MIDGFKAGATLSAGIDHENYNHRVDAIDANLRESLLMDLH